MAAKPIARIAANSPLAIYLPNAFTIHGRHQAFASGGAVPNGWAVNFAYVRNCGGANACSMASFAATKRKRLSSPRT